MKKLWLLDPGHGGIVDGKYVTSGKRSPVWDDGSIYYEGVGNRDIVRRIAEGALCRGISTKFIVDPENQKDVPLESRVHLANRIYRADKRAVYLSIHSNAFKKKRAHGWEVWTSKGQTDSDILAAHLIPFVKEHLPELTVRKDMSDGDPDKESNLYVLRWTDGPSVLTENGFHTNEEECRKILMTEEGRQRIADTHLAWMQFIDDNKYI